jgi:LacI family transcriptional regulator
MQVVADTIGVSKSTVSLALRGDPRIPEATRLKVQETAEALGYRKNPIVDSLMAHLRSGKRPAYQGNIALINCSSDPDPYANHTFRSFRAGILARADALGHRVEQFWLEEPSMRPARLRQILETRGIRGLVLIATVEPHVIHKDYTNFWDTFACSIVGVTHIEKQFPCATNDQYLTSKRAVEEVLRRGYKRPGIAIDFETDELLDFKFTAGFSVGSRDLGARSRLKPFDLKPNAPTGFINWVKDQKPDAIITNKSFVRPWLEEAGWRAPEDIGLLHLDWHEGVADWAGMNQNNELVAAAGADLVINQLNKHEFGPISHPKLVLLESDWVEGKTLRSTV